MRFAALLLISLASPALALDLPIQGTYGVTPGDCAAARAGAAGAYVAFEGASLRQGGQGQCDVAAIRRTGPQSWALVGVCVGDDAAKTRKALVLSRHGKFDVVFDGRTYRRCGG